MPSKKKPLEVFVCYAHRDRKYFDKLRAHLSGLVSEGRIVFTSTAEVRPDKSWDTETESALNEANIAIPLLTSNFVAAQSSVEHHLREAWSREGFEGFDLVPVLVEAFDTEAYWLSQVDLITVDGMAVTESRQGSVAWADVARQVRLKVESLEGARSVLGVLNEVQETVRSGTIPLPEIPAPPPSDVLQFSTVSAFWRVDPFLIDQARIVSVQGTFSSYAPMLMGRPQAKRALHLAYRKAIETNRRFGERKRVTINACLSLSAGQMVQQVARMPHRKVLLGLYESIVRNSIPVYVLPEYYDETLAALLDRTGGSGCFEAVVTGRPYLLNNNFIRRYLSSQQIDKLIDPPYIDNICRDAYALEVGGPGTGISLLEGQPSRYVDGDVWLAVRHNDGSERFATGFTDISNKSERETEMDRLRSEAEGSRVIASCDQLQSIEQLFK